MSREMKDSGIEWIGNIPKEWEVVRFKFVCEMYTGNSLNEQQKEQYSNTDAKATLPYVSTKDVERDIESINYDGGIRIPYSNDKFSIAPKNSVLLCIEGGSAGKKVGFTNQDVFFVNKLCCIRTDKNPRYLYYFILSHSFSEPFYQNIQGLIGGVSVSTLKNFLVSIPLFSEQQKIADYLDKVCGEIDEMIALQEKIIEELKAYKQSVITEAVTKGLNPNVPMRDSGIDWIGEIPKHWSICKIKHCLSQDKNNLRVGPFGAALTGNDFKSEGYWVYNQRCVLDNNFTSNDTFVNEKKYNELKSFEVLHGDILITTRGSIGKIAIVPENAPKGILHPCIIRFVINNSIINISLLKHIFNESDFILRQMRYQSNSTTIDVLYSYTLKNLVLTLPPLFEQCVITSYLDKKCSEIDSLIAIKQKKIEALKEYKKSVIYEYVTGKKQVN